MPSLPSLVAFGSLTPWPSQDQLYQLRRELRKRKAFEPIIAAVHDLALLWKRLVGEDRGLEVLDGKGAAEELPILLAGTGNRYVSDEKRNIMTMPMTIFIQIVQYVTYLEHAEPTIDHSTILENVVAGGGIQGFCAGLLSALAVASGRNIEEVGELAASSVKLAFCIGAYIDLDYARDGVNSEFANLAVRWKSPCTLDDIQEKLLNFPDTYVAVIRDMRDVNVTTLSSSVTTLQQELSGIGVSLLDTGLGGRYHSSVHKDIPDKILKVCSRHIAQRFGDQNLVRSNIDASVIPRESPICAALQSILTEHANWYLTIKSSASKLNKLGGKPFILSIGPDAIPQSVMRTFPVFKVKTILSKVDGSFVDSTTTPSRSVLEGRVDDVYPENAIAVIGMSCKFPGADSIEEFCSLLTDGKSMLDTIPKERFKVDGLARPPANLKFWGNFIKDIESFDHKFFKKTPREAASMDPQQRLLLQATYQALESSGYFSDPRKPRNMGCYIGACATDYDSNVGSYAPGAYSTIGTLRAFLSGKLSHHFGWSGPSLTFDTACSSSAVAIHTACTALQMGECSQAIAGGVALFTSPYLYENLAAAHFLSPTGATKPFDANADGYCRGEGIGIVVLKRLSDARVEGDHVLGVIAGSAINQNANCVPITVPHPPSQSDLYQRVANQAGVDPHKVSFVEAHGTGTPVGDPIEIESIRQVFGGPNRNFPLFVSSVKGNIGHLEGASGVASLIKALLQMEHRVAYVQASFKKLNPKIPPLDADKMCIPTSNCGLSKDVLTACINNYGAAGSNAAMILIEAPAKPKRWQQEDTDNCEPALKFPIQISAGSAASLTKYCQSLDDYCKLSSTNTPKATNLPNIAFSLARRQNQALAQTFTMTCTTMNQFQSELRKQIATGENIKQRPKGKPIVLCFGGQVSDYGSLSERFWKQSSLFRFHLNDCDETLRSMGYPSLYPAIFETKPIEDIVVLQSAIFSIQFACSQAWIDSGLRVDGLVGHSLGQLTALCVARILSLRDGLKLVAGRASLMKEHWGAETGTMIAVEAEQSTILSLTNSLTANNTSHTYEFACYNGPRSQVIVSDKESADELESELLKRSWRHKRLNVTHGFHSRFTEPLISPLERLASSLTLREPEILIETCTDVQSWEKPTPQLIAAHTREPVFFEQAVKRLQDKLGACSFLEIGSHSSVTSMARKALRDSGGQSHSFVPMELNKKTSTEDLVELTVNLWNLGHQVQFWNFHRLQSAEYSVLRLPPYEFERPKHWLKLEVSAPNKGAAEQLLRTAVPLSSGPPPSPPSLIRFKGTDSRRHYFEVDSTSEEWHILVSGHVVLGKAECPVSLFVELAARAVTIADENKTSCLTSVQDLRIESPLELATDRQIDLDLQYNGEDWWAFRITSKCRSAHNSKVNHVVCHATGGVALQVPGSALQNEFSRFERLTGREQFAAVVNDADGTSVKGSMVYKVYSKTVEYAELYRNVKSLDSSDGRVVGKVVSSKPIQHDVFKDSVLHPHILQSFFQVADIHARCIFEAGQDVDLQSISIDRIQFGPEYYSERTTAWNVHCLSFSSSGYPTYDLFVYDRTTERLALVLLGVHYTPTFVRNLASATRVSDEAKAAVSMKTEDVEVVYSAPQCQQMQPMPVRLKELSPINGTEKNKPIKSVPDNKNAIYNDLCTTLEKIADVERCEVKGNTSFEDMGVDSLMMIEIIAELSSLYKTDLPVEELEELPNVDSFVEYLDRKGCKGYAMSSSSTSSSSLSASMVLGASRDSTPSQDGASAVLLSPIGGNLMDTTLSSKNLSSAGGICNKLAGLLAEHLELERLPTLTSNLADLGFDSLLCIELATDIQQICGVDVHMEQLNEASTFEDLVNMMLQNDVSSDDLGTRFQHSQKSASAAPQSNSLAQATNMRLGVAQEIFEQLRFDFDIYAKQTAFHDFWKSVYPEQSKLVEAYIVEAFRNLGCDVASLTQGQELPPIQVLPKHAHLMKRLCNILTEGGILEHRSAGDKKVYVRTSKAVDTTPASVLYERMLQKHPKHASETKLLNVSASVLSESLMGKTDPLSLLFANKINRAVMADVYENAPMCQATTRLLADFIAKSFIASSSRNVLKILEVGAGTGGTARHIVDLLTRQGIGFEYTFTDISSALVSQAKKSFASHHNSMKFMTLDCDKTPPAKLWNQFDIVIATNCIHATRNATTSASNIAPLLLEDGIFCLVEFTYGIYWFDLVYGLLEGWWLFDDGRQHALADQWFWDGALREAGFKHVSWTDGSSREAQTVRVICAFKAAAEKDAFQPASRNAVTKKAGIPMETFTWKKVGNLELQADVYFPKNPDAPERLRPVALMIHGGGHLLFGRQDIPMKHVRVLLQRGFLPVSVDYRLCPELSLYDGPITDCCDSLKWCRDTLPFLPLSGPKVQIEPSNLLALGWSSGGQLAMTLGYTAKQKGIRPPEVILPFYSPSDLEAEFWSKPIFPKAAEEPPTDIWGELDCVREEPILAYTPKSDKKATALSLTLKDDRARLILHMNWRAQSVPVLIRGLPHKSKIPPNDKTDWKALPPPSKEEIRRCSPYWHIIQGTYTTPTFMVHGSIDDWIPYQMTQKTIAALQDRGVPSGILIPEQCGHAFDLFPKEDRLGIGWAAIEAAYDFACAHLVMRSS